MRFYWTMEQFMSLVFSVQDVRESAFLIHDDWKIWAKEVKLCSARLQSTCMYMILNASRILSFALLPFYKLCYKGLKSFVLGYKSYRALIIYYMIDFLSTSNIINYCRHVFHKIPVTAGTQQYVKAQYSMTFLQCQDR